MADEGQYKVKMGPILLQPAGDSSQPAASNVSVAMFCRSKLRLRFERFQRLRRIDQLPCALRPVPCAFRLSRHSPCNRYFRQFFRR